jgi:hypothetical protein
MLARVIYFSWSPDASLIGVIPDDAFYYIQLARHRATDGFWTFDGTSPATGFHFLFGYFLVACFSFLGDIGWRQLYVLVGLIASVSIALSALFTFWTVETVLERKVIPIAAIPFFGWEVLVQSTAMVESWLVLFFAALTAYSLVRDKRPTLCSAAALIALGIAGSLSRTDFGLWPAILFGVFLIRAKLRAEKDNALARSALILAGSIIGALIVVLHNYSIAGHFAPASAQVKLHWSVIEGHNIWDPVSLIAPMVLTHLASVDSLLGYAVILLWAIALPLLVRAALASARERHSNSTPPLITGSLLAIVAYVVLYRHNSASLQIWYASNFVVPVAISVAFIAHFVTRSARVFAGISLAYFVVGAPSVPAVVWPWQAGMLQAGLFLRDQAESSAFFLRSQSSTSMALPMMKFCRLSSRTSFSITLNQEASTTFWITR